MKCIASLAQRFYLFEVSYIADLHGSLEIGRSIRDSTVVSSIPGRRG